MKNIATLLSLVSLALIALLFFMFFNHTEQLKKISLATEKKTGPVFKVAYFEMDSLEVHYNYFVDAEKQLQTKEESMNSELGIMEKSYQKKISEWQQKGTSMTQAESQQASQEYATMQQNFQSRKQTLQEELLKEKTEVLTDIKKKIEAYLKDYNKQKSYSFIFAYDPTTFIYYKDSTFNITGDIIDGLNAGYKKKN